MEDKLLDELMATYKGDAFADWLKVSVEKNGDLVTAEKRDTLSPVTPAS